MSFATSIYDNKAFLVPCWERNPRKGILQPDFIVHRFPIKGGLSMRQVWDERTGCPNPLLRMIKVPNA